MTRDVEYAVQQALEAEHDRLMRHILEDRERRAKRVKRRPTESKSPRVGDVVVRRSSVVGGLRHYQLARVEIVGVERE